MAQRSRLTPLLAVVAGLGGAGLLLWAASSSPTPAAAPPPLPDPQGPPEPNPADGKTASPPPPPSPVNPYQPPPGGSTGPATENGGSGGPFLENTPPAWPASDPAPAAEPPPPDDALQAYRLGWWNTDAAARGVQSPVAGADGAPPSSPLLAPWYELGKADRMAGRAPRYAAAQTRPIRVDTAFGEDPAAPPELVGVQRQSYVLGYLHRDAQDPQRRYYFTVATDRPTSIGEWQRWWDLGYQDRAAGSAPRFPVEIVDTGARPVPQVDSRKGGL